MMTGMESTLYSWDYRLIFLSLLIVGAASYTAFDLASNIKAAKSWMRYVWLIVGAFTLGTGIWSMHFTGMLALDMHHPMRYKTGLTLTSYLISVSASSLAFVFAAMKRFRIRMLLFGGVLMGLGLVLMHFVGMSAMVTATQQFKPVLLAVCVMIAVVASTAALWMTFYFSQQKTYSTLYRLAAALIMVAGVASVHYVGMAAAPYMPVQGTGVGQGRVSTLLLGFIVAFSSLLILTVTLVSLIVNRRFTAQERHLLTTEQHYQSLFAYNPDAVFTLDLNACFVTTNKAVEELFGYYDNSLIGQHITPLIPTEHPARARKHYQLACKGVPQDLEVSFIHHKGHTVHVHVTLIPNIINQQIVSVYGIAKDITVNKTLKQQLQHQAYYDALTGLPNRTLFMNRLREALERKPTRNTPAAVLFLDLDNFKIVNDSLGHKQGDELLMIIARRLLGCLRPQDTAARLGGDEFTILLDGISNNKEAINVAERILDAIKQPVNLNDHQFVLGASIGIAISNNNTADELLRDADTAMYRAKNHGKAAYELFTPSMNALVRSRLELESDLRLALERSEFRLLYQPKIDISSGRFVGVEALLRWMHPVKGFVSPAEFIPVAEESNLIIPIGLWVLEEACAQMQHWREAFPDLPLDLSVNLSVKQFENHFLVNDIRAVLNRSGLAANHLILEITESVVMQHQKAQADTLESLRNLGVKLAIDDFGTGYSSLAYLKHLPVNYLKMDRSFVSGLGQNHGDMAIAQAIVVLAHTLGLEVVAEGIETRSQLECLTALACDQAQGYYFYRPLDASAITTLLMDTRDAFDSKKIVFNASLHS